MLKGKINIEFLLTSLETLTPILKIVPKAASEFLFRLSFSLVGEFSQVYSTVHVLAGFRNGFQVDRRLPEQFLASQAAIGKQEQASRNGLLEGFSKLVSDFIEASKNFSFDILHYERVKNCENHHHSSKL